MPPAKARSPTTMPNIATPVLPIASPRCWERFRLRSLHAALLPRLVPGFADQSFQPFNQLAHLALQIRLLLTQQSRLWEVLVGDRLFLLSNDLPDQAVEPLQDLDDVRGQVHQSSA